MLIALFNFTWITISSYLIGKLIEKYVVKEKLPFDLLVIIGIVVLTVYAQTFSLFGGVKVGANLILFLFCLCIGIVCCINKVFFNEIRKYIKTNKKKVILYCIFGLLFCAVSCHTPMIYDSSLYHAQAIRWIEEYGAVPGLGNLHNRLAYDSSFMCLQALFSWNFLTGKSLHCLNAFWAWIMFIYVTDTFRFLKDKNYFASDILNISIVIYTIYALDGLSSPSTDYVAMTMVLYIFSRWLRSNRKIEKVVLVLFAIWTITIKLSAVAMGFLVFYPVVQGFKKRRYKELLYFTLVVICITLPFFARNIIISGYLLYPYPQIDFFNVDWKMPEYTVTFDSNEIMAWGRNLNDVFLYDYTLQQWFPIWFNALLLEDKVLVIINVCSLVCTPFVLYINKKSKRAEENKLLILSLVCLATWFLTAPLIRYGYAFIFLNLSIILGNLYQKYEIKLLKRMIVLSAVALIMLKAYRTTEVLKPIELIYPMSYKEFPCYEVEMQDEVIYVPVYGDRTGYEKFPSTPYLQHLQKTELRGSDLKEGFKIKEEYVNTNLSTYGYIVE